jgi:hypothetical protein
MRSTEDEMRNKLEWSATGIEVQTRNGIGGGEALEGEQSVLDTLRSDGGDNERLRRWQGLRHFERGSNAGDG